MADFTALRLAISDPGSITPRLKDGDEDIAESISNWGARAVTILLGLPITPSLPPNPTPVVMRDGDDWTVGDDWAWIPADLTPALRGGRRDGDGEET